MQVSRRQFFKISAAGLSASSMAVLGLYPATAMAEVRQYKLARAKEVRNTCTYCSVGCGVLLYSLGMWRVIPITPSAGALSVPRALACWTSSTALAA